MKVIVSFLLTLGSICYSFESQFLPNPFTSFGQQEIFEVNSPKWIEQFALKASSKQQHLKALHAWCYLLRINYPQSKIKIISLLDLLNKPLLKYVFLAHYKSIENLNLKGELKRDIYQFLEYLKIREKTFRGLLINENEFKSNKYALSEYYYQKLELTNQKYYLNHRHKDPFNVFDYHRIRSLALSNAHNHSNQTILSINNDYFSPHVTTLDQLNYGLDDSDISPILIDAEHISFLIQNQNFIPSLKLIKKYPYLLLSLITRPNFILTNNHWKIFLTLLQNPFWTQKIKFIINKHSHLKSTLGSNLHYIFPKIYSEANPNIIHNKTLRISGFKIHYSNHTPKVLLNSVINAAKGLNVNLSTTLPIRWLNIKTPFIFDPIESELIVSTKSIFWSDDMWKAVLLRNQMYHKILKQNLTPISLNEPLPPLWLLDSIVNSKTKWSPSIHGVNYKQAQHLSLFPLTLYSLYNYSRNRSRKNLFFAYHWQCKKLGEILFKSMELSEILNKIKYLQISQNNPSLLYQKLSIYFDTSLKELKNLIPQ